MTAKSRKTDGENKAVSLVKKDFEKYKERAVSLSSLIEIYQKNREWFFILANNNFPSGTPSHIKQLSALALKLKDLVGKGFDIDKSTNGHITISGGNQNFKISKAEARKTIDFLNELNGVAQGKDKRNYYGDKTSEAELLFKLRLDDEKHCGAVKEKLWNWMNASPTVLTVHDSDLEAVKTKLPRHTVYNLMYCATKVVQNPTVVFEGVRFEGRLKKGFAYCGVPRFTFDNKGERLPRPDNMVFLVFTDAKNHVFSWDWVKEDKETKNHPCGWRERFGKKIELTKEVILTGVDDIKPSKTFSNKPWYSSNGDCIFFYADEKPCYAERVNDELTIFISFEKHILVGCKMKNVSKIVSQLRQQMIGMLQSKAKMKPILASSYVRQVEKGASEQEHSVYKDLLHFMTSNQNVEAPFNIFGLTSKTDKVEIVG